MVRAAGCSRRSIVLPRGAPNALREARQLRQLLDATSDGVVLCRNGLIAEVNAPLCRLLGLDRDRLIGRRLQAVLGVAVPAPGRVIEVDLATAGGPPIAAEVQGRAACGGGRGVSVLAVRDMTERKRTERRWSRRMGCRWRCGLLCLSNGLLSVAHRTQHEHHGQERTDHERHT